MPAIKVSMFAGMQPAIASHLVSDETATQAVNVNLSNGELRALENTAVSATQPQLPANCRTLFKYGTKFLAWSQFVEAIPSPVIGDPYDRVYFTGTDKPRVARNDQVNGAGVLPTTSFPLGVPAPSSAPTISYSTAAGDPAKADDDVTRYYGITYVTSTGEESALSPVSARVVVLQPNDTVTLTWPTLASNPNNITHVRLYRTETGAAETAFFRVVQLPIATTNYVDNVPAGQLGAQLATLDYAEPPATMRGICSIAGGITLGFDDRTLLVSEAYEPYTYPKIYRQTTKFKIVGICPMSSGAVIGTEGHPYLVTGTMPGAIMLTQLDEPYPCVSRRSMVNMDGFAMYASQDGLVGASSGGAQLLTSNVLSPDQWRAMKPETMHAYYHDGLYIAFYGDVNNTGAGVGALIYDPKRKDIMFVDFYATAGYRDLASDTLFLVISQQLCEWRKGALRSYIWQSKVFQTPLMSFAAVKVKAMDITGVKVTVYGNEQAILTYTYPSNDQTPLRLPPDCYERWQIKVEGTKPLQGLSLATSMQEL